MKFLLALTFLLAFLALALTQPDTDRDVELLRDNLVVRDKREPGVDKRKKAAKRGETKVDYCIYLQRNYHWSRNWEYYKCRHDVERTCVFCRH